MKIESMAVGMYETNCFLLHDEKTGEGAIIDPGSEGERIIERIEKIGFKPQMILLTHGHIDHIGAVTEVREKFNIPLWAGKGEEMMLTSASQNMSAFTGMPITCAEADRLLTEGDVVAIGATEFAIIATPGHSPGGICFYSAGILFCGDTLFNGSVGRTDFPGCSHERLIGSIMEKLMVLPEETICYPGHGPSTSIGAERIGNPFLTGGSFG